MTVGKDPHPAGQVVLVTDGAGELPATGELPAIARPRGCGPGQAREAAALPP
jgi:hypothetical protein